MADVWATRLRSAQLENGGESFTMSQSRKSNAFDGGWWSLCLPSGWISESEDRGASFHQNPRVGTLQISAARKEDSQVTDQDLMEFAADTGCVAKELKRFAKGLNSGFLMERVKGNLFWREWWIRDSQIMIYVTYIVPVSEQGVEREEVDAILASLRISGQP